LTPIELGLYFPTPNYCAKFRQILFTIATVGAMTDTHTHTRTRTHTHTHTHTHRQTDRRQRSYNLSHAMQ